MKKIFLLFSLLPLVLSACAGVGYYDNRGNGLRVQVGRLVTDGVKITANDGTFILHSNQDFMVPFHMDCNLEQGWEYNLSMGAKPVQISFPGITSQYHGVMAFCTLPMNAKGPATRYYEVSIPNDYLQSATGGRISSVYETVDVQHRQAMMDPKMAMLLNANAQQSYGYKNTTTTAWVLWFSDRKFAR